MDIYKNSYGKTCEYICNQGVSHTVLRSTTTVKIQGKHSKSKNKLKRKHIGTYVASYSSHTKVNLLNECYNYIIDI